MTRIATDQILTGFFGEVDRMETEDLAGLDDLPIEAQLETRQRIAQMQREAHELASRLHGTNEFLCEMDQLLLDRAQEHFHPDEVPQWLKDMLQNQTIVGAPES